MQPCPLCGEESIVKLRAWPSSASDTCLARTGRERYGQIVAAAQNASKRLEDYIAKLEAFSGKIDGFSGRLDEFKTKLRDYSGR
jgi:hypothetical protein